MSAGLSKEGPERAEGSLVTGEKALSAPTTPPWHWHPPLPSVVAPALSLGLAGKFGFPLGREGRAGWWWECWLS